MHLQIHCLEKWEQKLLRRTDDLYVIYGYDDEIDEYINVGRGKVNVCISVNYDEIEDVTCVYFSTPMNNQDF